MNNNEKIAKYMGFTHVDTDQDRFWNPPDKPFATIYEWTYHSLDLDHVFNNYNGLMPVVEKINSGSGYDSITIDNDCVFLHRENKQMESFKNEDHAGMKGAIYAAVCEYVNNLKE